MVTDVPTGPPGGVKLVTFGVTRNCWLLVSVPEGVVTVTKPVLAPVGTAAVISELETTLNTAAVPLNVTLVAPVSFGSQDFDGRCHLAKGGLRFDKWVQT